MYIIEYYSGEYIWTKADKISNLYYWAALCGGLLVSSLARSLWDAASSLSLVPDHNLQHRRSSHVQHQGAKLFCPSHFYSISQQNGINSTLHKHGLLWHENAPAARLTSFAGILSYTFWELEFKRASQFQHNLILNLKRVLKGTAFILKIYLLWCSC